MGKVNKAYKLEKTIKKLEATVAELGALLREESLWPEQETTLKKAVFDLEEQMSKAMGLFLSPSNWR